jgi:hypothetical protein
MKGLHSPIAIEMETVLTHIKKGSNTLTMDFQWMIKENIL